MSSMKPATLVKIPALSPYTHPEWFHYGGKEMKILSLNEDARLVLIESSFASLLISSVYNNPDSWFVRWFIVFSQAGKIDGHLSFSSNELRAAFGLSAETDRFSDWLIEKYGGSSATEGKYISWKRECDGSVFINIPGPGTGRDGDPNVSIEVSPEMGETIKRVLKL